MSKFEPGHSISAGRPGGDIHSAGLYCPTEEATGNRARSVPPHIPSLSLGLPQCMFQASNSRFRSCGTDRTSPGTRGMHGLRRLRIGLSRAGYNSGGEVSGIGHGQMPDVRKLHPGMYHGSLASREKRSFDFGGRPAGKTSKIGLSVVRSGPARDGSSTFD